LDEAAHLNYLCNDYGIDTMETGVTLGVAMESGLLAFGDYPGAVSLLGEIAQGTVLGRVIGQGAAIAGRVLGVERVPAVKGQGISAYDPRAVKGLGVTYATSPMGADHTAGFTFYAKVDHHSPDGQVETSRAAQLIRTAMDATGMCAFVTSAIGGKPEVLCDLINAVYGTAHEPGFLMDLAKAVLRMERAFNLGAGFTRSDDRLPDFMRTEQLPPYGLVFDVPQEDLEHLFDEMETDVTL
jgi:aldehyde:ferredoxin oxidoreductase